jgi:hypothetical protein
MKFYRFLAIFLSAFISFYIIKIPLTIEASNETSNIYYYIDEENNKLYRQENEVTTEVYSEYDFEYFYVSYDKVFVHAKDVQENEYDVILSDDAEVSFNNEQTQISLSSVSGSDNETTVYEYLKNTMGLNTAAACGVLSNIKSESSFNPNALGDSGTSYGICQWHNSRWTKLQNFCNDNGYDWTTLEGQLHYLEYELKNSYPSVWNKLINVANTSDGAYEAGWYWCYYFEIPANKDTVSVNRGNYAKNTYWEYYKDALTPVDLGTGFEAGLLQNSDWVMVVNSNDNAQLGVEQGNINERWWFERQDDGSYTIESLYNNKFLDASGMSSDNGTNVQLWEYNGSDAQKWYFYQGDNGYIITPKYNQAICWDCTSGSTSSGTNIQLWEKNNTTAQGFAVYKFRDKKVQNLGTDFYAVILNKADWKAIAVCENNYIKIDTEDGTARFIFKFHRNDNGSYTITSAYNGEVLDVEGASDSDGAKIQTWSNSNTDNQRWYIYSYDGGYILQPRNSSTRVLDCNGGYTTDGTDIQIWEQNNTSAQTFSIYMGDDIQLKPVNLTVTAGTDVTDTIFDWNEIYGEKRYDLKIWENALYDGDAYHIELGSTHPYAITLPEGHYEAYVDSVTELQCLMSNTVSFDVIKSDNPSTPITTVESLPIDINISTEAKLDDLQLINKAIVDMTNTVDRNIDCDIIFVYRYENGDIAKINIQPITISNLETQTVKDTVNTKITELNNNLIKSVDVYVWDSVSGMKALSEKSISYFEYE